jgi:tetratricopeptide (TPR) repeat protein
VLARRGTRQGGVHQQRRSLLRAKYPEAALQYRNALQQNPKSGDAHLKLAKTLELTGNLNGAAREYVLAADALPGSLEAQTKAAQYLLLAEQFEDARARANKALAIDPKNVDAQVILASMTVPLFEQAVRKQPENAEFQYHLGVSAVKAGELTKGRKALEQASGGRDPVIAEKAKKALAEL